MKEYRKPLPHYSFESKKFWNGCKQHELLIQKCQNCGTYRYYPSPLCPQCSSWKTEWTKVSGKGKVYTYIVTHHALHPAFAAEAPYVVAIVELDEGVRLTTNLVDCKPDEVFIGMPVEVVFEDVTEDISLPKFSPVK